MCYFHKWDMYVTHLCINTLAAEPEDSASLILKPIFGQDHQPVLNTFVHENIFPFDADEPCGHFQKFHKLTCRCKYT